MSNIFIFGTLLGCSYLFAHQFPSSTVCDVLLYPNRRDQMLHREDHGMDEHLIYLIVKLRVKTKTKRRKCSKFTKKTKKRKKNTKLALNRTKRHDTFTQQRHVLVRVDGRCVCSHPSSTPTNLIRVTYQLLRDRRKQLVHPSGHGHLLPIEGLTNTSIHEK